MTNSAGLTPRGPGSETAAELASRLYSTRWADLTGRFEATIELASGVLMLEGILTEKVIDKERSKLDFMIKSGGVVPGVKKNDDGSTFDLFTKSPEYSNLLSMCVAAYAFETAVDEAIGADPDELAGSDPADGRLGTLAECAGWALWSAVWARLAIENYTRGAWRAPSFPEVLEAVAAFGAANERFHGSVLGLHDAYEHFLRERDLRLNGSIVGRERWAQKTDDAWRNAALAECKRLRQLNGRLSQDDLAEKLEESAGAGRIANADGSRISLPKRTTLIRTISRWESVGDLDRRKSSLT